MSSLGPDDADKQLKQAVPWVSDPQHQDRCAEEHERREQPRRAGQAPCAVPVDGARVDQREESGTDQRRDARETTEGPL